MLTGRLRYSGLGLLLLGVPCALLLAWLLLDHAVFAVVASAVAWTGGGRRPRRTGSPYLAGVPQAGPRPGRPGRHWQPRNATAPWLRSVPGGAAVHGGWGGPFPYAGPGCWFSPCVSVIPGSIARPGAPA